MSDSFAVAPDLGSAGVMGPDAAMYAVRKSTGEYNFWTGCRRGFTTLASEGGQFSARKVRFPNAAVPKVVLDYPCPDGYPKDCMGARTVANDNVGMWPSNVYQINDDEVLMWIHLEFRGYGWNVRHGLAYSSNGGKTFKWCGYVVAPAGDCGKKLSGKYPECPNMGLSGYIIKDGFFQIYYHDSLTPMSGTGSGGSIAVARAAVADVVAAARVGKVTPWFKYYNGAWTEPAVGGGTFTPLNIPPEGYMHGDAIYIEPLKMYALLQQSGDRDKQQSDWHKEVLISFSYDGITWTKWQTVYAGKKEDDAYYVSLMSYGPDNEVAGKTFAAVFLTTSNKPKSYNAVNVTVSLA